MEHEISTTTTLINVGIQLLNLILFFWLFKYLFGWKIIWELQERKKLISKLQNAEQEYGAIVKNAQDTAAALLVEANDRKKAIIDDATAIAKQKTEELIAQATNKADSIAQQAIIQANALEYDLKENYEVMVKTTAGSYLKKIFDKEPELQSAYVDKITKGFLNN